jgi:hypothetical protein
MYSAAQNAVYLGLDSVLPGGVLNAPAKSTTVLSFIVPAGGNSLSGLCFSSYHSCFLRLFGDALLSLGIQVLGNAAKLI